MIPPISLKVNIDDDVEGAVTALVPSGSAPVRRTLWFAEAHPGADGSLTPLLSSRIVILIRSGDEDDISVTLRPCAPGELPDRWSRDFDDGSTRHRVEASWCGPHRFLTASVISTRPPGSMAAHITAGDDPVTLLDPVQRQFVVACTSCGVPIDHLATIGPITTTTWRDITLDDLPVVVDRWTVGDLDILEVSTRLESVPCEPVSVVEARARARLGELEAAIRRCGLQASDLSRTERVLHMFRTGASDPG